MNTSTFVEPRLLGAVLSFELAKNMVTTGLWMLQPTSLISKIAHLSSSSEVFAVLWMTLALAVLPYMVLQIVGKPHKHQRNIARAACCATLTSGFFWVYLAYLGKGLDYGNIVTTFLFDAGTCVVTAALLAHGLNLQRRPIKGSIL